MKRRRATVVRVEDASTLIIRPYMAVRLAGWRPPYGVHRRLKGPEGGWKSSL